MQKVILITGATDGIGLATAEMLVARGHHVLLHGRSPAKLEAAEKSLSDIAGGGPIESYVADLSRIGDVEALAKAVLEGHARLDVLINNAGVLRTPEPVAGNGLDVRFVVNTLAPYLLTQRLIPLLGSSGRVVNLSSAAQAPVDARAISGQIEVDDDFNAYAQSKLAITMWSRHMAQELGENGPMIVAVNPGSLLGSKMVKEGFGVDGGDIAIGADILTRAALTEEFESASGLYFDNDSGKFASPHQDALDTQKTAEIIDVIETILAASS